MSEAAQAKPAAMPPHAQGIQMATAFWATRLLYLTADLKLADLLAGNLRTAEQLAQLTATHAPSLYRVMRALASLGIFTEDSAHRFCLTALVEALRPDAPGSARASVLTLASAVLLSPSLCGARDDFGAGLAGRAKGLELVPLPNGRGSDGRDRRPAP